MCLKMSGHDLMISYMKFFLFEDESTFLTLSF